MNPGYCKWMWSVCVCARATVYRAGSTGAAWSLLVMAARNWRRESGGEERSAVEKEEREFSAACFGDTRLLFLFLLAQPRCVCVCACVPCTHAHPWEGGSERLSSNWKQFWNSCTQLDSVLCRARCRVLVFVCAGNRVCACVNIVLNVAVNLCIYAFLAG